MAETAVKKLALRVSEEQFDKVNAYAESKGISLTDAADKLIDTAVSRLEALSKYGKKQKKEKKAAAKAEKAPKAHKPKAQKTEEAAPEQG